MLLALASMVPRTATKRHLLMLLALALVPVAAGQGNGPCALPCGRQHTCGDLNGSFTCADSTGLGCDCTGCCLASLSPLPPVAPPASPPPLPPPPSSPSPLLPPMAPGGLAVGSTAELRAALATEGSTLLYLLPVVFLLGGSPLNVSSGMDVIIDGLGGGGATLDAEGMSRAIDVSGGGHLTLRRIHVINGKAPSGGGLLVQGAGSSLLMEQASVRGCVATGTPAALQLARLAALYTFGGGALSHVRRAVSGLTQVTNA